MDPWETFFMVLAIWAAFMAIMAAISCVFYAREARQQREAFEHAAEMLASVRGGARVAYDKDLHKLRRM